MNLRIARSALLTGALAGAFCAGAADYYVTQEQGIAGLLDVANNKARAAGDVIHVAAGRYEITSTQDNILMAPGVTMVGGTDDPADTVIHRGKTGNNDRTIHVGKNGWLRNLTLSGGYTDYQAATVLGYDAANGVHNTYSVSNCIVEGGSALYKGGGTTGGTWYDSVIRNCVVRNGGNAQQPGNGGGIHGGTLYNCIITNNYAHYLGGGIGGDAKEPCVARNCLIAHNTALFGGAAGTVVDAVRLYDCVVSNNLAELIDEQRIGGFGGGLYGVIASNCVVECCTSRARGGGGYLGVWRDCVLRANRALNARGDDNFEGAGGGCYGGTFYDCLITNNMAFYLGGGLAGGTATGESCKAYRCQIVGNQSPYGGGMGVKVSLAPPSACWLEECTVVDNFALPDDMTLAKLNWGGRGGGLYGGYATNCVFRGNVATYPLASDKEGGGGGGMSNATAIECLFEGNVARQMSGGDFHVCGGAAEHSLMTDCQMVGNSATAYGGATLGGTNIHCVITGNRGNTGGAALNGLFVDCVVTNNFADGAASATYRTDTRNCLIAFNHSMGLSGRGVVMLGHHEGDLIVSNVADMVGNSAWGGALTTANSQETVSAVNCTIADNVGGESQVYEAFITNCIVTGHATVDVSHSDRAVRSLWQTGGAKTDPSCIVGENPKFRRRGETLFDHYALFLSSPVRNKGIVFDWMVDAKDIAGNPRLFDGGVDLGALECCKQLRLTFLFLR